MRKQIVILLASLAILPGASASSESHLRGVSPEANNINVEDIIATGSKPKIIRIVREKNLYKNKGLGLSPELASVLNKVYFPEDGKVPTSEEVKAGLSSPLAKAVLESSEFHKVLRSKEAAGLVPWFYKPLPSTAEFIKMYSHPNVVKVVKSDTFKTLLKEAGMPESMLNAFLAIYHPKAGEMKGKSLSDYVKEQLSSQDFADLLGDSDFKSSIFNAKVANVVLSHYTLA